MCDNSAIAKQEAMSILWTLSEVCAAVGYLITTAAGNDRSRGEISVGEGLNALSAMLIRAYEDIEHIRLPGEK